jgi:hypothetical protein
MSKKKKKTKKRNKFKNPSKVILDMILECRAKSIYKKYDRAKEKSIEENSDE